MIRSAASVHLWSFANIASYRVSWSSLQGDMLQIIMTIMCVTIIRLMVLLCAGGRDMPQKRYANRQQAVPKHSSSQHSAVLSQPHKRSNWLEQTQPAKPAYPQQVRDQTYCSQRQGTRPLLNG